MIITIIVGTNSIEGKIIKFNEKYINVKLNKPACIPDDSIIILCNKTHDAFHISAYGYMESHDFEVQQKQINNINNTIDEPTLSDDSIDIDDI
jgi:hypothetical protein